MGGAEGAIPTKMLPINDPPSTCTYYRSCNNSAWLLACVVEFEAKGRLYFFALRAVTTNIVGNN